LGISIGVDVKTPKLEVGSGGDAKESVKALEADYRRKFLGVVDASALHAPIGNKANLVP
jgi:hypothetical protein